MGGFIPTVCKTATFNGKLTFWALFRTLKKRIYKIFSIFSFGQHRKLIFKVYQYFHAQHFQCSNLQTKIGYFIELCHFY